MNALMKTSKAMLLLATTMLPVSGLAAQDMPAQDMQAQGQAQGDTLTTAYGPQMPAMSEMTAGPDLDGIISARSGADRHGRNPHQVERRFPRPQQGPAGRERTAERHSRFGRDAAVGWRPRRG